MEEQDLDKNFEDEFNDDKKDSYNYDENDYSYDDEDEEESYEY